MNLEYKTKEDLINLVKYYRSEYENVARLVTAKKREISQLNREITTLKKKLKERK